VLGYTLEEIARASSAPLNTVKSRLRLAKQVLRAKVAEDPWLADLLEAP
jgi:RNA polymerase sigma-70 factor (ECF subfamily)